jgi:hypothetical protein
MDAVAPDLSELPDVVAVDPPVTHQLEATYLDTAELHLARAGITLRRRTGGEDAGWHLKIPTVGGMHEVHVGDELRWLSHALADARDTQVMHERLADMIGSERPELVRLGTREHIDRELVAERRTAFAGAVESMESKRYFDLLDAVDDLSAAPPWKPKAGRPAKEVLPDLVRRDWKRLRKRVGHAEDAGDDDERARLLHDVRKYVPPIATPMLAR